MTLKDCPQCGGTHYGQNKCPYEDAPTATAVLSEDGMYRYRLGRRWAEGGTSVTWILINPSTATADKDDPTSRKCVGFAKALGHNAMEIVNLYAYRATEVRDLRAHLDIGVGSENDGHILEACGSAQMILAAWGPKAWARPRAAAVLEQLRFWRPVYALRRAKDGSPCHPLMLPYSCKPVAYQV
jgi:hypothetical protein